MILRWVGGKSRLAEQIISTFPPHKRYIEPFFGAGWVYFKKEPSDESIINDINSDLTNLYIVIRDQPQDLVRMISYTPPSEEYFNGLMDIYWNHKELWSEMPSLQRAFGYYYLIKSSFNGMGKSFSVFSATAWNAGILETIEKVSQRLKKSTSILNRDYQTILDDFATEKTLVYLDPPYAVTIDNSAMYYEYLMNKEQHELLRTTLLTAKFKWVLSYDIHPMVTTMYSGLSGIHIHETAKMFQSSVNRNTNLGEADNSSKFKSEYIITNFNIQTALPLFESME